MKIIIKVIAILTCYIIISPAMSFNINQLDPTRNPHYKKQRDKLRTAVQKTAFYVNNNCARKLSVKLDFIPINSSSFTTNHYTIRPGQHGYLVSSTNRNFYISATSPANSYRSGLSWNRKRVDVGNNKEYTYNFYCR